MREILFKAKQTNNAQWVEGYFFKDGEKNCYIQQGDTGLYYLVNPVTVCEFTGFYDTSVRRIFESDQGSGGTILLGDITLDGRVDISDAVLLNKATAGSVMLNEQAKDNAECYADGNIDANDSTALLQFLVHTIASLPVRE